MINKSVDVLIIGGGLTGATLLLALQGLGYSTLLLEAKPFSDKEQADFDARTLALSPATQRVLNTLGVWSGLEGRVTPIEMIHVSEKARFGKSRLYAKEHDSLGYVVEMPCISHVLHNHLPKEQVLAPATLTSIDFEQRIAHVSTPSGETYAIKTQLIVAADGAQSTVRTFCQLGVSTKDYQQQAIVANIAIARPHMNKAFERFLPEGPMALLPIRDQRMALVWANSPQTTEQLMALSDQEFLQRLQKEFGYQLGRFLKTGKRNTFPLRQVFMPTQVKWPVVFVGNAAHTLHPVAGQGFNLGLRDVACLAQAIKSWGLNEAMLDKYMTMRRDDQKNIMRLTNGLIDVFTSRFPGVGLARNASLLAFDMMPALKKLLARYASGYGGIIPDLVCDIALHPGETDNESSR